MKQSLFLAEIIQSICCVNRQQSGPSDSHQHKVFICDHYLGMRNRVGHTADKFTSSSTDMPG